MEPDCDFCVIVNGQTGTEILMSDDELVCFRDVKPGAAHHYLVIPRTHIENCKSLQGKDIPLVERMKEMGLSVLLKSNVKDLEDIRLGFHIPPFNSVPHLHLHVLAPTSKMNSLALRRFGPQSHWFLTVDKALSQLRLNGKIK
ncbi:adenosine 5'-monophosphoramidase HINT3-like [Neosynchiropus ocellatus]